jgi:hypothetical protein
MWLRTWASALGAKKFSLRKFSCYTVRKELVREALLVFDSDKLGRTSPQRYFFSAARSAADGRLFFTTVSVLFNWEMSKVATLERSAFESILSVCFGVDDGGAGAGAGCV